jgi:hypothetical protein
VELKPTLFLIGAFEMKKFRFLLCLFPVFTSLTATAYQSYAIDSPEVAKLMDEQSVSILEEEAGDIRGQIAEIGYQHTYSENAQSLMAIKDKKGVSSLSEKEDPYYSILRLDISFALSFPFKGLDFVDDEHLLGHAPSGSFENGKWTGVTSYFNSDKFGICKMSIFDMPALQGISYYDSKYTVFDINGKPTNRDAEGSPESGFLYDVTWTGERYKKELECANNKPFDKQMLEDLVTYAKKIDSDLFDTP